MKYTQVDQCQEADTALHTLDIISHDLS